MLRRGRDARVFDGPTVLADRLLTPAERGNPATRPDARHPDGRAWSAGNRHLGEALDAAGA